MNNKKYMVYVSSYDERDGGLDTHYRIYDSYTEAYEAMMMELNGLLDLFDYAGDNDDIEKYYESHWAKFVSSMFGKEKIWEIIEI